MAPSHDKLHSASLHANSLVAELNYTNSTHEVALIQADETNRKLRFQLLVAQNDCDQLREILGQEEVRSDTFEASVTANLSRAHTAEARLQDIEHVLRDREAEMGTLRAESRALQLSAKDSEAFLTEKLALTRELAGLRPQVEHLREQARDCEKLWKEKLELQRLLSDAQCEAENARRDAKRALAKRRNTGVEIAQEEEVAALKRDLAREKRARQRAEEAADVTQMDVGVEDVRKELAREKRARQKAEEDLEAAQENTQVEDVRRDLLREKKAKGKLEEKVEALLAEVEREKKAANRAAKRAEGIADADDQVDALRDELEKEKKARLKAEKATQKVTQDAETARATLDEKLGQFRNKLKTTKEKLKEAEAELAASKSSARPNPKKRGAAAVSSFDADATTLGTPGDGNPAATKRGRKAAPGVGDKSTFSITPFLNRTASILPEESPVSGEDEEENVSSPIAKKATPLTSISTNTKKAAVAPRQRKPAKNQLDAVVEGDEDALEDIGSGQENLVVHATKTIKTKIVDGSGDEETAAAAPTATMKKEKKKKRKSLADFKTFDTEPEISKKTKATQKSRKLGGMSGTIFDNNDDDDVVVGGGAPPRGGIAGGARKLFLGRGFGAALGMKKIGASSSAASIKGGSSVGAVGMTTMLAGDGSGFVFSPLKRRVRNLDDTLMG